MDYTRFTCVQLRQKLETRKAATNGLKAELIARLQALDDAERPPKRKAAEIDLVESDAPKKMHSNSNEIVNNVQVLLQCPICVHRMGGQIHQVQLYMSVMSSSRSA